MFKRIFNRFGQTLLKAHKFQNVNARTNSRCVDIVYFPFMEVRTIPALHDSYMYLLIDPMTKDAAAVDPVDADTLLTVAGESGCKLKQILITHHHWNHAGGNDRLSKQIRKVTIRGGDHRILALNKYCNENECFKIGNLLIKCIATPCHTKGHMAYYVRAPNSDCVVFTGDTLFQGTVGKFLEGTPEHMHLSLSKLAALPNKTKVFGGHENSLESLQFAHHVEPYNSYVTKRIQFAELCKKKQAPTWPSSIGEEKLWNPFMRLGHPAVRAFTKVVGMIQGMGVLRKELDEFDCEI